MVERPIGALVAGAARAGARLDGAGELSPRNRAAGCRADVPRERLTEDCLAPVETPRAWEPLRVGVDLGEDVCFSAGV